jgi:hypothetical protein
MEKETVIWASVRRCAASSPLCSMVSRLCHGVMGMGMGMEPYVCPVKGLWVGLGRLYGSMAPKGHGP